MTTRQQTGEEIDAYYKEKLALLDTLELNRYERMTYGRLLFDMWRTEIESIGNAKIIGLDKPTEEVSNG